MEYEWFESKRLRTKLERRLDFADARFLLDGRLVWTRRAPRNGEMRFITVGMLEAECVAVVWMERDGARRIISMRRARSGEEREYLALLS